MQSTTGLGYIESSSGKFNFSSTLNNYIYFGDDIFNMKLYQLPQGLQLRSGTYNGETFVGVGNNCYAVSSDMQKWKAATDTGVTFDRVIYGNNLFVANSGGYLYTSKDGYTWEGSYYGSADNIITSICFAGNRYVAVRSDGKVLFSENGLNWKSINIGVASKLNNVKWIDNQFIALGDKNTIATSSDGVIWKVQKINHIIADKINLLDAIVYNKKIYVLGTGGAIFYTN
jgi:hypothetical protein